LVIFAAGSDILPAFLTVAGWFRSVFSLADVAGPWPGRPRWRPRGQRSAGQLLLAACWSFSLDCPPPYRCDRRREH